MRMLSRGLVAACFVGLSATAAAAAADPALVCQAGKLTAAGKYGGCRLAAESKAAKAGTSPDFSKCDASFEKKFTATETKAGMGVCPSEADRSSIEQRIAYHTDAIAALLAGGSAVDPYSPASGQTTSYGAGDDGDVEPGATLAYIDNGDGTITDLNTGLMWEKKIGNPASQTGCTTEAGNCANPHHVGNYYTWSASSPNYDGRVVSIFLNQLNNRCNNDTTVVCTIDADCAVPGGACGFAGHRDWRLPGLKELQSIVDLGRSAPAVDPVFNGASCGALCTDITSPACSCTQSDYYWSSTTYQYGPSRAWFVFFLDGYTFAADKTDNTFVRAVRAGS